MQEIELLNLMLEHQDRLNSQIRPNWREQRFPWHRAIWMECAELMDCFPWKWWAKGETDWDNVKIELADLWHFILSWVLQEVDDPLWLEENILEKFGVEKLVRGQDPKGTIESLACGALRGSLEKTCVRYVLLLQEVGLSLNDLARIYFGKNVLNQFRQKHGLKEGRYRREWNGVEDNRVMLRLIEGLEVLPLERFEAELTQRLEAEYIKAAKGTGRK